VAEDVPADLLVEMDITLKPNTHSAGILFHTTPDLARGYMVCLEPNLGRVVFDHCDLPPGKAPVFKLVSG
jgi:hypothetical protein